jgi:hypothetical protein
LKRLQALLLSKLSDTRANFDWQMRQSKKMLAKNVLATTYLTPVWVSQCMTSVFILFTLASATYWLIHIMQIPSPEESLSKNFKGITLYTNQDINTGYKLFGSKPLAAENIALRVLVVTGKNDSGMNQGFALFNVDGKSTGAVAVGEQISGGMVLQSINPESATLIYQGKELIFSLQKSKSKNASNDQSSQSRKTK